MYNAWITTLPPLKAGEWVPENNRGRMLDMAANIMSITGKKELSDIIYEMTEIFVESPAWYAICQPKAARAFNKDLAGFSFTLVGHRFYNEWYWIPER
jgi:hypothetical protein